MIKANDKKHNLARGFADVNTPSVVENELMFNWNEKKEDLTYQIDKLTKEIELAYLNETKKAKIAILKSERLNKIKSLNALGVKINKRVDFHLLLIDRLRQITCIDDFERCCFLAREDKKRILENIPITNQDIDQPLNISANDNKHKKNTNK